MSVSPPAPTIADIVTIRVQVTRRTGEPVAWPDWTSPLADWSVEAVAIDPPRRVADGFVEAVTITASPYLPGDYSIGPFTLAIGADDAQDLVFDAVSITIAGPPPQTPLLEDLLPAPAAITEPMPPQGIWLAATAIALIGTGAGITARRWSASADKQTSHDALADLERIACSLRSHDAITPTTLDELDQAARGALSQVLNMPKSLALCELAAATNTPALEQFASELDRARFQPAKPSDETPAAIADGLPAAIAAIRGAAHATAQGATR